MSRLATTAIGGLAALTALLLLRGARKPAPEQPEYIVIHAQPRYDTPALMRPDRAGPMVFVPLHGN